MGLLSKWFGTPEAESKTEEKRVSEPPAEEQRRNARPKRSAKSNADGSGIAGLRDERIVLALVERVIAGLESITKIEHTTTILVGMFDASSKSGSKSEQDRRLQFLDLRAHFTREMDELRSSLHGRMVTEAAIEVFSTLLPALDDMDHVLHEASGQGDMRGIDSLRLVRRKLRNAFSRMGIEEIRVDEGVTLFDPQVHEGQPYDGDDPKWNGLPATTIVQVQRMGYVAGEKVLRCTVVSVIKG